MTCVTFFRRLNNSSHWRSRAMSAFLTITPGSLADSTSTTSSSRNPSSKVGTTLIASFVNSSVTPSLLPPSLLALQQKIWKRGMYDPASRRCAFYCLQKVKSEDSIWPPREDSRAICRKFSICTKRWQQLNIFLQNNFLCCLTFLLRPRRSTKPFPSTFHKW